MTAQTPIETTAPAGVTPSTTAGGGRGTRWTRAAALTGVVFTLAGAGSVAMESTPQTTASSAKISHYYTTHQGQVGGGALLTGVAVVAGICFGLYLRTYLRRFVPEWMTSLFFTGVLLFAISGVLSAGIQFALADHPKLLSPDSLRTLNSVEQSIGWAPLAVGLALTYAAVAMMIRSAGKLPAWLGWVAWLTAAVAMSFFLAFFAFMATGVFVLIASIRMAQRNPDLSGVIRL